VDALSDALRVLRLTGAIFLDAELTAPWCAISRSGRPVTRPLPPGGNVIFFHFVTEGRCKFRLAGGGETLEVQAGDVVLLPRDDDHLLGSDLMLKPVDAGSLIGNVNAGGLLRIRYGGGGEKTRFGCGYTLCDERLSRPLLDALPRMVRVPMGEGPATAWIRSLMQTGATETAAGRPGSETVRAKLAELLFVEVLRRYMDLLPKGKTGWLAGLRDEHIGRALGHLHQQAGHDWTVDELATRVGLSRSALAQRFTDLVGQPPMQYLTRWRITVAAQRLRTERASLSRIAGDLGYDSEAAFNRAFKRELGATPAAWRRGDMGALPE
jgi:AraC-like DNA-binding protein